MYTILISMIITGIVVFFATKNDTMKQRIGIVCGFGLCMGSVLGMCLAMLGAILTMDSDVYHYVERGSCKIVSARSSGTVSGTFFLGCGTVSDTEYYFYYKVNEDGSFERGKVRTSQTVIHELDEQPRVIFLKKACKEPYNNFLFAPNRPRYKLIVPKGTIIQRFELR